MLIRIVRNLTPERVAERIKNFEHELRMSFEKVEELFFRGGLTHRQL
ncbi:MAG: hypothetical protein QXQ50_08605 [Candidatus Bathyarchaeia archaeon]